MNTYVLGGDASKHQDKNETTARPNFKKAYAAGWRWVALRVAGGAIVDEDIVYNWQAAKDAGLLRMAYSFIDYTKFTGLTATGLVNRGKQHAEIAINAIKGDRPELGFFADWERPNNDWPALPPRANGINILTGWYEVVDNYLGKLAGFYGNEPSILNLMPIPDRTKQRPLWMATWPTITGNMIDWIMTTKVQPAYAPWPKWTFWQFTAHGDGPAFGMESSNVDLDVFNGSLDDLYRYAGMTPPGAPAPVIDPALKARLDNIEARLFALEEARLRTDAHLTLFDVKARQIKDIL